MNAGATYSSKDMVSTTKTRRGNKHIDREKNVLLTLFSYTFYLLFLCFIFVLSFVVSTTNEAAAEFDQESSENEKYCDALGK
jgi:hypothetical protein